MATYTGSNSDETLTGSVEDDLLYALDGNDTLEGLEGADTLQGGLGDDTYRLDDADLVVELEGEGFDAVHASLSYTLAAHVESLVLTGTAAIDGTGNSLDNFMSGNAAANLLEGGEGWDTAVFDTGAEWQQFAVDGSGDLQVVSYDPDTSEEIRDRLRNIEALQFSAAVWQIQRDETGRVTGLSGSGIGDTFNFSLSTVGLSLNGGFGYDILNAGSGHDSLYGGDGADALYGGLGNDLLSGADFFVVQQDTLEGGQGDDLYLVDALDQVREYANQGTDTVHAAFSYTLGSNLENLVLTGSDAVDGIGNGGANRLTGNSAANVLIGGVGDDTYVIDALDTIVEYEFQGTDTVEAGFSYTLAAGLENLMLTGTANLNGTGNDDDNVLTGNAGVNVLTGGLGNDTYDIGAGDTIVELEGEGEDTVRVAATWTLADVLEHLQLTGTGHYNGTGNSSSNRIIGNSGRNRLDGAAGVDTLEGGGGDDKYYVDDINDLALELSGQGWDTVYATQNFSLSANIEALVLQGGDHLSGFGNSQYNKLTGNSGNNTLNGGGGIDTLAGGSGDDTYVVDTIKDVLIELADGGIDAVQSSVNFSLAAIANIERLVLTGGKALTGTGNGLNNEITAAEGNHTLDGGLGADTLSGGAGDDKYYVDNAGDRVMELTGGGVDTIHASLSYTLPAYVERLVLSVGAGNLNGMGNSAWNRITGNEGDNVLSGGSGNDSLFGGAGNDTYVMRRGGGSDQVSDADSSPGNADVLWFNDSRINHDQLWFRQVGNDLEVAVIGTGDKATIKGWYASPDNIVEEIRAGDGLVLESGEVDALVSAMSAFGARPAGATTLTTEEQAALNPVFAATWS